MVRNTSASVQPTPRGNYAKSVDPSALDLQVGPLDMVDEPPPAAPADDNTGTIAVDPDRRPDPHARRNAVRHTFPATPSPMTRLIDEVKGQYLDPADGQPEPDAAHGGGLLGRIGDALVCGMAAAEAAPRRRRIDPLADQLNDDGRNELAGIDALARMTVRECPGVVLHLSYVVRRDYDAAGDPIPSRRPPLVHVLGNDGKGWADAASDEDPEKAFAALAGKFKAAHADANGGGE